MLPQMHIVKWMYSIMLNEIPWLHTRTNMGFFSFSTSVCTYLSLSLFSFMFCCNCCYLLMKLLTLLLRLILARVLSGDWREAGTHISFYPLCSLHWRTEQTVWVALCQNLGFFYMFWKHGQVSCSFCIWDSQWHRWAVSKSKRLPFN
jgi:hypothetical protein